MVDQSLPEEGPFEPHRPDQMPSIKSWLAADLDDLLQQDTSKHEDHPDFNAEVEHVAAVLERTGLVTEAIATDRDRLPPQAEPLDASEVDEAGPDTGPSSSGTTPGAAVAEPVQPVGPICDGGGRCRHQTRFGWFRH
jgi:hypothetical protein